MPESVTVTGYRFSVYTRIAQVALAEKRVAFERCIHAGRLPSGADDRLFHHGATRRRDVGDVPGAGRLVGAGGTAPAWSQLYRRLRA